MFELLNSLAQSLFDFYVVAFNYDVTNEYLMGKLYEQCLGIAYVGPIVAVAILGYLLYVIIERVTWKWRMDRKWRKR